MIDIGANLAQKCYADDLKEVIDRTSAAGVDHMIVTGTDVDSSAAAAALTERFPGQLFATAGVHPHHADDFSDETLGVLETLLQQPSVLAVGETGLDFNRNFSTPENQIAAFEAQLSLAMKVDKPLFLHERDAFDEQIAALRRISGALPPRVIHCFTGPVEKLYRYLDEGCHIGVTGWICDEKRGAALRESIVKVPHDRLMIESDAPYLTPHKKEVLPQLTIKHRNEPWTMIYVARAVAAATGETVDAVIERTTRVTKTFFGME